MEISESTSIPDGTTIVNSFAIRGSDDPDDPVVVTLEGTVTAECPINIFGYVEIRGGTIQRNHSGVLIQLDTDRSSICQLTIKDTIIDGQNIASSSTIHGISKLSTGVSRLILSGSTEIYHEKNSSAVIYI